MFDGDMTGSNITPFRKPGKKRGLDKARSRAAWERRNRKPLIAEPIKRPAVPATVLEKSEGMKTPTMASVNAAPSSATNATGATTTKNTSVVPTTSEDIYRAAVAEVKDILA